MTMDRTNILLDIYRLLLYCFSMISDKHKENAMKKIILLISIFLLALILSVGAKEELEKAPSFSLNSMENETVYLDSLLGQYVVIDFWAIYCKSCIQGLDDMKDIFNKYKEKGLVYLAINEDGPRNISKVPGFVKGHKWGYTVLYDENEEVKQLFGIQAIPEVYLLDREGNIILRHRGFKDGDENVIKEKLEELYPEEEGNSEEETN